MKGTFPGMKSENNTPLGQYSISLTNSVSSCDVFVSGKLYGHSLLHQIIHECRSSWNNAPSKCQYWTQKSQKPRSHHSPLELSVPEVSSSIWPPSLVWGSWEIISALKREYFRCAATPMRNKSNCKVSSPQSDSPQLEHLSHDVSTHPQLLQVKF